MKINFEKKHLYIISGVILLLFSSVYVIAQTSFTSPAWTAEKQSHGVLYTDFITSKSTTDPNRKVTVEAELDAKGGISLGGIKRTTWPTETGSSTGGGRECYTVQRARTEYGVYTYFTSMKDCIGYVILQIVLFSLLITPNGLIRYA